jgi:hypothetical protein
MLQFALHASQSAPGTDKAGFVDFLKHGDGPGLFALEVNRIEPTAIPTPFARGQAMAAALRLSSGVPAQHAQWQTLLLGVTLGHVEIDLVDLRDPGVTSGRMRAALKNADDGDRRRFLGLLRTTTKDRAIVGGTDTDSLLWPSPRRFDALGTGDATWSALKSAVDNDPRAMKARQLWWGWRKQLDDAGWWHKSASSPIPWMRGIDWTLDGVDGDPDHLAIVAARGAGPLRLVFIDPGLADTRRVKTLYLPVLDETAQRDLLDACMLGVERKGTAVELKDAIGKVVRSVRLPAPVGDAHAVDVGAGIVTPRAPNIGVERPPARTFQLDKWFETFTSLYNVVTPAILHEQRLVPFTAPDPIRLVTLRLGDLATKPARPTSYSRRAMAMLVLNEKSGQGRLPPMSALGSSIDDVGGLLDAPRLGALLSLDGRDQSGANRPTDAVFVERWGVADGATLDVGDLSAVGALLWAVFSGAADVDAGSIFFDGEALSLSRDERPFEFTDATRDKLMDLVIGAKKRLATLQRFVAAFPTPPAPGPSLERLLWLSARAFARRAFGSDPRPQGAPPDPKLGVKATVWPGVVVNFPVSEDTRG